MRRVFVFAAILLSSSLSYAEDAASIQARLEAQPVGEAVSAEGTNTLDRPLIVWRDRTVLASPTRATLKTTGAFPPLIIAPPIRRYPGFAARHRVPFPLDGSVGVGLDLSDARLTLRGTGFERLPQGSAKFTIAALIARKGSTWGNNDTAPIFVTETDRLGYESLRLVVDSTRIMLDLKTQDGARHQAWFRAPASGAVSGVGAVAMAAGGHWADSGVLKLVVLVDLEVGKVAVVANGVVCDPMTNPNLTPGSKLAYADFPNLTVGWCPYSGQGSFILGGLRVCGRLVTSIDSPNLTGTDIALFGPSNHGSDVSLDLAVPMSSDNDPCVWYRHKTSRKGCGVLVPAGWSPWDSVAEIEIRNLDLQCGDNDYGQAVWSGPCLRLKLTDCTLRGGARGFDQHPQIVSYKSQLSGLGFYDNSEVAMCIGNGIVHASDLTFNPSPKRNHIRWHSAGGVLEHFFIAEGNSPLPIDIRAFTGQLAIRDGEINREVKGPEFYIRVRRGSMGAGGKGRVADLEIDGVEVGAQPADVALIDLDDSVWKGKTEHGTAKVEVRRCFGLSKPGTTIFRGVSAAWAATNDGVPVAPDPIPVPTPGPAQP